MAHQHAEATALDSPRYFPRAPKIGLRNVNSAHRSATHRSATHEEHANRTRNQHPYSSDELEQVENCHEHGGPVRNQYVHDIDELEEQLAALKVRYDHEAHYGCLGLDVLQKDVNLLVRGTERCEKLVLCDSYPLKREKRRGKRHGTSHQEPSNKNDTVMKLMALQNATGELHHLYEHCEVALERELQKDLPNR